MWAKSANIQAHVLDLSFEEMKLLCEQIQLQHIRKNALLFFKDVKAKFAKAN